MPRHRTALITAAICTALALQSSPAPAPTAVESQPTFEIQEIQLVKGIIIVHDPAGEPGSAIGLKVNDRRLLRSLRVGQEVKLDAVAGATGLKEVKALEVQTRRGRTLRSENCCELLPATQGTPSHLPAVQAAPSGIAAPGEKGEPKLERQEGKVPSSPQADPGPAFPLGERPDLDRSIIIVHPETVQLERRTTVLFSKGDATAKLPDGEYRGPDGIGVKIEEGGLTGILIAMSQPATQARGLQRTLSPEARSGGAWKPVRTVEVKDNRLLLEHAGSEGLRPLPDGQYRGPQGAAFRVSNGKVVEIRGVVSPSD